MSDSLEMNQGRSLMKIPSHEMIPHILHWEENHKSPPKQFPLPRGLQRLCSQHTWNDTKQ